jgi:hypothetical protein
MSRPGRTRWLALGLLALGLVGSAASAFETQRGCCPDMAGKAGCEGFVAVSCCEAGLALAAQPPAAGARCEAALPSRGGEPLRPRLLPSGTRSTEPWLARSVLVSRVLRL